MNLGAETAVAEDVACLLAPLQASDDMLITGPTPGRWARLFIETGTDLKLRDVVVVDGERWHVQQPPFTEKMRGDDHHLEAVVERQEVS